MVRKAIFLTFILFSSTLFAADGKAVIEKMIYKLRGHANIAVYEMTVQRPAWTRSVKLKIWDNRSEKKILVRILEPLKDQGTGFLRIGYNLWNYLPQVEKVMKIPPSMMLQPWMGSDFSNDDLVKESSYIDDYDHQIVGKELREGAPVLKIELIPHPGAPVVWGKVIYWVRAKEDLPVEEQFLDEKGRLIKDLTFKDFKIMDGVLTPSVWVMKNVAKEGQSTTIRLLEINFDPSPPIPESVFTEKNLRR